MKNLSIDARIVPVGYRIVATDTAGAVVANVVHWCLPEEIAVAAGKAREALESAGVEFATLEYHPA
jgi:hypothetical protein